jgi:glutathione S-transferase
VTHVTTRTLYHFRFSPFSRRVRLALACKGLDAELREARENPAWAEEARKLVPLRTIPVLVDGASALGDSTAITRWLDAAYPDAPRLWPDGEEAPDALQVAVLVDVALNGVIDLGTRYYPLREHASWPAVKDELLGRAQLAVDALAQRASELGTATVCKSGWSAADMALLTMTLWCEGWPQRASSSPNIAQLMTLGFRFPAALSRWADAHRSRPDVVGLG